MRSLTMLLVAVSLVALLPAPGAVAVDGIILEVTAGSAAVTDWVAEARLDLGAARELLRAQGRPDQIVVVELDAAGAPSARVTSQVDPGAGKGLYTVAWRVPGTLDAGAARRFLLTFDVSGEPLPGPDPITVRADGTTATVVNGAISLQHDIGIGGMIRTVTIDGASVALDWNDKIYDGTVYYLRHTADRMDVAAAGPLRATIELECEYLDAGKSAPSRPRAVYRFTNCAGLPFTRVEADVTQDFAHQWISLHFIEMQIGAAGFTHFATDLVSGSLAGRGEFKGGAKWASVYNDNVLIAACASTSPGVWDGGGKHYGGYLRSGTAPMDSLRHPWQAAIIWAAGADVLKGDTIQRWSEILADPPVVQVAFGALETRVADAELALQDAENRSGSLSGEAWAASHVAVTLARSHASAAREYLQAGSFRAALAAVKACEETFDAPAGEVRLRTNGSIQAGTVKGHPYLGSDNVAYLWSKPANGAGLISIFDRRRKREFLRVDPDHAPFWEVAVKRGKGGANFSNLDSPCNVSFDLDGRDACALFRWTADLTVAVEARLTPDDSLLRARISVATTSSGLTSVTFPSLTGIIPISPQARQDHVLDTRALGRREPSPLVSGKRLSIDYPAGMQFTAIIGDGAGLYFAEEDGQANRKSIALTPDTDSGFLKFAITHPVLNWGADQPVLEYGSPGDVVCGPFQGDWYDAARIYRKWALTAPWCAKGPITRRADYPQWLAKAPYWTLGHLNSESGIADEIAKRDFFGIPIMVCHAYNYWFAMHQDDRYPEQFPPRFGSEGFKRVVADLQSRGIRIVPYVNGWIWDADTESWRTKDAERKGAILGPTDNITFNHTSYGGGQSLIGMCPATQLWRDELLHMSKELVGRYGADGIYYDFLTIHTADCYNKDHGHPICGGDFWTSSVHDTYDMIRTELKKLNPDVMLTGEDIAEYCIDVLDTFLCLSQIDTDAPLFLAVYHGYTNIYGGEMNKLDQHIYGPWWLWGAQNGWTNGEIVLTGKPPYDKPPYDQFAASGAYYRDLLKCRWEFATPYLAYGRMLRPPRIQGDFPTFTGKTARSSFPAVEGSAWLAPDGTVGVFFLNYDDNPHDFTWNLDLAEDAGLDTSKKLTMSQWTHQNGLAALNTVAGGPVTETMTIPPWGMIALKLEIPK